MRQSTDSNTDTLQARRIFVQFTDDIPRYWANGDPVTSAFFAALSTIFPDGERLFIHAVRHYLDAVPEGDLKEAMQGFVGQEAFHGRVHQAYNAWLSRLGYPVQKPITQTKQAMLWFKKAPPILQVAFTAAFEHFTAILGEALINDSPEIQQLMDEWHPTMRKVWLWHGLEESEHKAVAFDVFQHAGGGYALRVSSLILVSLYIWIYLSWLVLTYLKQDGQLKISVLVKGLKFLWLKPGMFRRTVIPWLSFFKPGFHPWQRDNRQQLEEVLSRLKQEGLFEAPAVAAAA